MGKVFKTVVFGGFKKREVIEYLDGLSQKQKADETRFAGDTLMLETEASELRAKLADAEAARSGLEAGLAAQAEAHGAKLAEVRDGLDATLGEQTVLRRTIEQLREEKAALLQEKAAFAAENERLRSRILDFDDERRVFEAGRQSFEEEMAEQRRELESRIFDLEAEVLEGLEQKAWVGHRQNEDEAADFEASAEHEDAAIAVKAAAPRRPAGRIVVRRRGQPAPEPKAEQTRGRLGSVRDILQFVRKKDGEEG